MINKDYAWVLSLLVDCSMSILEVNFIQNSYSKFRYWTNRHWKVKFSSTPKKEIVEIIQSYDSASAFHPKKVIGYLASPRGLHPIYSKRAIDELYPRYALICGTRAWPSEDSIFRVSCTYSKESLCYAISHISLFTGKYSNCLLYTSPSPRDS